LGGLGGGDDPPGAGTQARVGVIDVTAQRLRAVPGAVMGGRDVGWAVSWSPDGAWLLLLVRVGPVTEQLAAWRPGDRVLHVPSRQPPTGQHPAPAGSRHSAMTPGTAWVSNWSEKRR